MHDELSALAARLREMTLNAGTLNCLGCGFEHRCGVSGCAVLKRAADVIQCMTLILEEDAGEKGAEKANGYPGENGTHH